MSDKHDRVLFLDAVRGVALCGILFINAAYFQSGAVAAPTAPAELTGLNAISFHTWQILFAGKFVALFSFLFGAGLHLFSARAQADRRSRVWPYLRRAAMLYVLGLLHSLVWPSDIIVAYAGVALLLMPLCWATQRTLRLVLAVVLLAAICVPLIPTGSILSFPAGLCFRLLPFAAGMYVARVGGFDWAGTRIPRFARSMPALFGVLAVMILGYALLLLNNTSAAELGDYLRYTSYPMAFCYFAILARFTVLPQAQRALAALAVLGRLSLTNYLTQDSVGALVVISLGLLPFGYGGVAIVVAIVIAVQLAWSHLWLRYFARGPLEWLLGWATYGRMR